MNAPVGAGEILAGKYQVERELGAGGMGVVVAARHIQLDEHVAIKFLKPESLMDPTVVARFLREGRSAAKIRSEHVARVYDVGTLENGAPYIVMEYLEGSDLAALVKLHGPLPVETAVEYTLQACEAIAEAHSLGIVHRDIKPANLFVAVRRDGSPVVKVIDFGISKVVAGADAGMDVTKTAEMRGSLLFMSPEQMTSPRDVDPRSDIWSIGIALYYLLTGAYPFHASTMPELCGLILQREPTPLRSRRPELHAGLEAVLLRCLRKERVQRYANVAELAAALADFAPPFARVSVDRISRMLGTTAPYGRAPLPSAPWVNTTVSVVAKAQPSTEKIPGAPPGSMAVTVQTRGAESDKMTGTPAQTGKAAWGSTSPAKVKRSGTLVVAGSIAGVTVFGALVALIMVLRTSGPAQEGAPLGTGDPPSQAAAASPLSSLVQAIAPTLPSVTPAADGTAPSGAEAAPPSSASTAARISGSPDPSVAPSADARAPRSKTSARTPAGVAPPAVVQPAKPAVQPPKPVKTGDDEIF